jgi:hypothetical protein
MTVTSLQLKAHALAWLRYGKRMPLVCTEVGRWNADVMGFSASMAVEVETKTTMADLRREFQTKVAKQYLYSHAQPTSEVPNTFYFMVPAAIEEAAIAYVTEHAPKMGVAVLAEGASRWDRDAVKVAKRASKLKDTPPSQVMVQMAISRASSELAGLYFFNAEATRKLVDSVETGIADVVRLAARASGTLDYETPVDDLDLRAKELAFCVEGVDDLKWSKLDKAGKMKWIEASIKLLESQYGKGWTDGPRLQ